ncbi:MAG: tetratricopeptide repeat protein [Neptuniibacter sp.]
MSLVNNMLRDLEQRNKKADDLSGATVSVKAAQTVDAQKKSSNGAIRYLLWVVGLTAIIATFWMLWQDYTKGQKASTTVSQVEAEAETNIMPLKAPDQTASIPAVDSVETEAEPQISKIETIRWSGTEQGGDLVVRLDRETDIQLLGQGPTSVTVALEGTTFTGEVPRIDSALVKRLDVYREENRTALTLQVAYASQFSFRVQHDPETLILGVLPNLPVQKEVRDAPVDPEPVEPAIITPQKKPVVSVVQRESKPVKKTVRTLSNKQSVSQALKLIGQGKADEAINLLEKRIASAPKESAETRAYLATVLLSLGDQVSATSVLQDALSLHPADSALIKLQVRVWLAEGEINKAAELLKNSAPKVNNDPEFYELLATVYQQQRKYDQAAQVYYSLLQFRNNTPRWWVGLGYSLELAKRHDEALNAYQSAVQIPGITASLKTYTEQRINALLGR